MSAERVDWFFPQPWHAKFRDASGNLLHCAPLVLNERGVHVAVVTSFVANRVEVCAADEQLMMSFDLSHLMLTIGDTLTLEFQRL